MKQTFEHPVVCCWHIKLTVFIFYPGQKHSEFFFNDMPLATQQTLIRGGPLPYLTGPTPL